MDKAKKVLDQVSEKLSILILAIMVVLVTWQVVARYIFQSPIPWSEQLSKYLFVWLVLINGAYMFGQSGHMNISFFKEKMPVAVQKVLNVLIDLVILVFALTVLFWGGMMALKIGIPQKDAALTISMGYVYAALPISGGITVLYGIMNLIRSVKAGSAAEVNQEVRS